MNNKVKVGVIGAGVNGIGSALAILQSYPEIQVTVYSDYFSPYTTGDGAAGLWTPYICPGTSDENIYKWSKVTWDLIESWYEERKLGILLTDVRHLSNQEMDCCPNWKDITYGFREFSQEELRDFGCEYINGFTYKTYIAEPQLFLPYLMSKIRSLGGKFQQRNVGSLEDIGHKADIIVNCSGMRARELVPDPKVYPVRGQIMRVSKPLLKNATFDDSDENFAYIIPNSTTTVLGGTAQEYDWRTTIDLYDSQKIMRNCRRLEPELKNAEVLCEWAGLRPARNGGVRLESDVLRVGSRNIPIVHNYGHGGSGITYFWGCSLEVRDLVGKMVTRYHQPIISKL